MNKGTGRLDPERFEAAIARLTPRIRSDRDLARRLGVGPSQPGKWRRGETTPAGENLARLCEVLGVSAAYLFGEDHLEDTPESVIAVAVAKLSPEQRRRLADKVSLWVEALAGESTAPPPARATPAPLTAPPEASPRRGRPRKTSLPAPTAPHAPPVLDPDDPAYDPEKDPQVVKLDPGRPDSPGRVFHLSGTPDEILAFAQRLLRHKDRTEQAAAEPPKPARRSRRK